MDFCLTTYISFATGIVKVGQNGGKNFGILQETSFLVERKQLFQSRLLGPLFAASICVSLRCSVLRPFCSGSVEIRCGLSVYNLQLPLSIQTLNVGLNIFFVCGTLNLFYVKIPQTLLAITSLDVSAVLLHPLQAVRTPHVAGAT